MIDFKRTLILPAALIVALLAGCGGDGGNAKPVTVTAYQTPGFTISVAADKVTLSYATPPPSDQKVTVKCGDLGDNGFENLITGSTTWRQGLTEASATMSDQVGSRDFCSAQLGNTGQVIGFLKKDAEQRYAADQKQKPAGK